MFIKNSSTNRWANSLFNLCQAIIFLLLLSNIITIYAQDKAPEQTKALAEINALKPQEYAAKLHQQIIAQRKKSSANNGANINASTQTNNQLTNYRSVGLSEVKIAPGTDIGFTFWRLVPADDKDAANVVEKQRIIRHKDKAEIKDIKVVAKRAESDAEFADGESIRFSVELPVESYIYLFDREQYVDGSYSDAYLIFPSRVDIDKTDHIVPNKLLFIPNESSFFTLERYIKDSPEKVAEVFTLLISPYRIADLPALDNEEPRKIDQKRFEQLINAQDNHTWKFEQERGIGLAITKAEKDADIAGEKFLTEQDNLPQTIYHVAHKPDQPFAITVAARIRLEKGVRDQGSGIREK